MKICKRPSCAVVDVIIQHVIGVPTTVRTEINSPTGRGAALLRALSATIHGDTLLLSANDFDLGNAGLDLSKAGTSTIHLTGAGKYATLIKSSVSFSDGKAIIHPGNNSQVKNLSIIGTAGSDIYQAPWGVAIGDLPFTNALLENVYTFGKTDGVYIAVGGCTATIHNCTFASHWDCVAVFSGAGPIDFYDCQLTSIANLDENGQQEARGAAITGNGTVVNFHNCAVSASGGKADNIGYYNFASSGSMTIDGGSVTTAGNGALDLYNAGGAPTMVLPNTLYDPTKVDGPITVG